MKHTETEQETASRKAQSDYARKYSGFVRTVKSVIEKEGLRSVELKLQFLESHPNTKLPKDYLSHSETVAAYLEAISKYKESIND